VAKQPDRDARQVVGFVGVGLDNNDGHQRLTRCDHFFLVGGSAQTHEKMQDSAIKFNEALERSCKKLAETRLEEVLALFHDTFDDD
jgi:hypothetical protein